jgi:plasmid stability protein
MAQTILRKLDDGTKDRLEARAARNGRSLEAEARAILEEAAADEARSTALRNDERSFGELMYERFKDIGLTEDEFRRFNIGIARINARSEMRIPDFEAEDYEPDATT